jgi:VanZ family protein
MAVIFLASSTPGDELPQFGAFDFSFKKGGHTLGYALLALGFLRGLAWKRQTSRRSMIFAVLFSFLYALSDEFHQTFTPGRTPSVLDVLIDTTGAVVGVAGWTFIRDRFFPRRAALN